jgi:hypothetical protein
MCLNGKLTVGQRFVIIANHYFPLSKALVAKGIKFMCRNYKWILLLLLLFSSRGIAASEISAVIIKSPAGSWSVSYTSNTPITRISFQRSPDSSRGKRWKTTSTDFKLIKVNDFETVSRVDGKPFTQVKFELAPTYISLPKDYAPFSPFTDGGMLFHSGRFFACPDLCDGSLNKWHIRIQATKGDNIIVDGVVYTEETRWVDSDSGQKNIRWQGRANTR